MNKWVFQQVEGVKKKRLELAGHAAPFGRERKDAVIKEHLKSRVQTQRYPGKGGPPTRHAFGVDWEDSEIKGRWMTRHLPAGVTANDMADDWTSFIKDESLVEMSWGSIVSYRVFIAELELAREDEDNIAWKMKLHVDERTNNIEKTSTAGTRATLSDTTEVALKALIGLCQIQVPTEFQEGLGVFDNLTLLIGALNAGPAYLNKLVNQLGNIENATFAALNQLRQGVQNVQTTVLTLREQMSTIRLESTAIVRSAKNDFALANWRATFDLESALFLDVIAFLNGQIDAGRRARAGGAGKVATAQDGDTWESFLNREAGGTDSIGAVREMNGARYGEKPIAGNTYLLP